MEVFTTGIRLSIIGMIEMDQISEFIASLEADNTISASTRNAYASDLSKFFDYLNSNSKQSKEKTILNAKSFARFLENEKKKGLKPSTLHRRRVTLKKYAEFLSQHGQLDQGSINEIANWQHGLWEEIAQREAFYLTDQEVKQLLDEVGGEQKPRNIRDKLIISLILETGLSIGALVEMNLPDVNLRSKQIRLPDQSNGWCPVTESAGLIQAYLSESRPELTQSVNEEALFVSQMGGRITRQGVWQVIRGWGEAAGLAVPLSPRTLRHTAVRKMIAQGKPVEQIQKLLGHGNRHSTQALIRKISKTNEQRRSKRQ